ncbi:MAG: hypothetical protein ACM3JP_03185 [Betaproteobacteria bacterium]
MFGIGPRVAGAVIGFAFLAAGGAIVGASWSHAQGPASATAMICRTEAIHEIDSAVGVQATVSRPAWSDHRYSCTYRYPSGSMRLSVKELPDLQQTGVYYHQLQAGMGDTGGVSNLGQGAFRTTNGSIVVRKDSKVLLVDVTGLPAEFGQPPTTSGNVALTVADVILACWSGD